MKIVVDTNIIFSAILSTNGTIVSILMEEGLFEFYSPYFIFSELSTHRKKIMKILDINSSEKLDELRFLVTKNIKFISESQIKNKFWKEANELTKSIDPNDVVFVALNKHLRGKLWTGDKKLLNGLKDKGYMHVVNTRDMNKLKS